jgi:peptide/nickel transport system permease protein
LDPPYGYLLRKTLNRLMVVVGAATLEFFIFRVLSIIIYGRDLFEQFASRLVALNPAQAFEDPLAVWVAAGPADEPLIPNKLVRYLIGLFTGRFGYSIAGRPIIEEINDRLFNTLLLGFTSLAVAAGLGVVLGLYAATNRRRGRLITYMAVLSYSTPSFILGFILIYTLAFLPRVVWGVTLFPLPPNTPGPPLALNIGPVKLPIPSPETLWNIALPVAALSLTGFGVWAYLMRQLILSETTQDYALTALAKGLPETRVLSRHIARNTIGPLVAALAMAIPGILNGSVIIEIIFSYNGLGYYIYYSMLNGDYLAVQAAIFIYAVLLSVALLISDILLALVDPRVRLR